MIFFLVVLALFIAVVVATKQKEESLAIDVDYGSFVFQDVQCSISSDSLTSNSVNWSINFPNSCYNTYSGEFANSCSDPSFFSLSRGQDVFIGQTLAYNTLLTITNNDEESGPLGIFLVELFSLSAYPDSITQRTILNSEIPGFANFEECGPFPALNTRHFFKR